MKRHWINKESVLLAFSFLFLFETVYRYPFAVLHTFQNYVSLGVLSKSEIPQDSDGFVDNHGEADRASNNCDHRPAIILFEFIVNRKYVLMARKSENEHRQLTKNAGCNVEPFDLISRCVLKRGRKEMVHHDGCEIYDCDDGECAHVTQGIQCP